MSKKCVARIGGRGELSIPGELIETPLCQRYYNQESWSKGLHDGTVARGGALQLLGERDRYLWFNGEDNYVSVFIDEFGIINGVTLDFWWFVEKLNKHQQMGIYTSGEPRLYLGAHEDNRVFGSVGDSYDGFGELTLGWHHLAIKASSNIMSDGVATIYLDGNLLGAFMFMGSSVGGIFTIGARGSNFSRPMRGVIREVKLWKRELSSSEIKDSMNGLIIPEYEEGVYPDLGYWPLNEGTGNTVQNRVNGSYDPITGATWIDGPVKYREPGSWISVPFDLKQITNASGSLIKFESSHPSTKVYTTVGEGKDLIADGLPEDIDNWPDFYQQNPDDRTTVKSIISDPTSPSGTAMRVDFLKEPMVMLGTIGCEIDPLEEGKTYTWSIWLKASRDTLLGGLVIGPGSSDVPGSRRVALTTSWKRYTHTFVHQGGYFPYFILLVPIVYDNAEPGFWYCWTMASLRGEYFDPVEENWAEQTSGEPISNIIPGVDYSGKHLWAKVKITPDDNDPSSSPKLQNLTLQVDADTFRHTAYGDLIVNELIESNSTLVTPSKKLHVAREFKEECDL